MTRDAVTHEELEPGQQYEVAAQLGTNRVLFKALFVKWTTAGDGSEVAVFSTAQVAPKGGNWVARPYDAKHVDLASL